MKSYSDQIDDRYYSILEEEFDLASELQRLGDARNTRLPIRSGCSWPL